MINLKNAYGIFHNFVSNYNLNNDIKRKYEHSYRVSELSGKIAEMLKLSTEEIMVAKLIGLLHDIGRFEQIKITNSLSDKKLDHTEAGNKILFQDNFIRHFIDSNKYDDIIYNAIKYHNKLSIPNNLDETTRKFCQILRDADKIDIFRVLVNKQELAFDERINKKVIDEFKKMNSISSEIIDNDTEKTILRLAFIFDINYRESFMLLCKSQYLQNYINSLKISKDNIKILNELICIMNKYINNVKMDREFKK